MIFYENESWRLVPYSSEHTILISPGKPLFLGIGGIIGVVTSVSPEGKEVTLKIDESTNAKLRILRSSIHEVLKDDSAAEKPSK